MSEASNGSIFRLIFEAAADAILIVGSDGLIRLANAAAHTLFEAPLASLIGRAIEDLIPARHRQAHRELRSNYQRASQPRPMGIGLQLRALTLRQREFPVEVSLAPASQPEAATICIVRDVTDRVAARRTERELLRARALADISTLCLRQRSLASIGHDVIALLRSTLAGDLLARFERAEDQSLVCVEADGQDAASLLGQRMPSSDRHASGRVASTGVPLLVGDAALSHFPVCDLLSGREMRCLVLAPVLTNHAVEGVIVVASRTPHRFSSDDLAFVEAASNILATALTRSLTEEKLLMSQRLESLGQLTGGVAHDFNNLLTVIAGNLQILEESSAQDEFSRRAIAAAKRASKRGAELTGKLLAFARRQTLQPQPIDVCALLKSFVQLLDRTLGPNIEIRLTTYDRPLIAHVDPGQLETALLNLAVNARDAMPAGGRLALEAMPVASPSASEPAVSEAGCDWVRIVVADNGQGMDRKTASWAFEPFFTTKAAGKGSGLGLSMVYGFVQQSSGHISLDTQPGCGTKVSMFLPLTTNQPVDMARPERSSLAPDQRPPILVIEDDPDVLEVARLQLEKLGYPVHAARNRRQALARLKAHPDIAVIFSDVVLEQGETGPSIVRALLKRKPQLRVVFTSGYARSALPLEIEPTEAILFLRKPYTPEELAETLAKACRAAD